MANRLALEHVRQQARIRSAAGRQIGVAWDQLAGPTDAAAFAFTEAAIGIDHAARARSTAMVDAYLSDWSGLANGEASDLLGIDPPVIRGGISDEELWMRPIVTARTVRSGGADWTAALQQARTRALQLAVTNVQLTAQHATRDILSQKQNIAGYRRVLGSGKNCDLCIVASTQRYHVSQLMPMHPSCGCTVQPIPGSPVAGHRGQVIEAQRYSYDADLADEVTQDAVDRLGIDITSLPPVDVVEHGELGPTLWPHGDSFTGPLDIAA